MRFGLRWDMTPSRRADLSGKEGFGKEQGLFPAPVNRLRRGRLGYLCNGPGQDHAGGGGEALNPGGRSHPGVTQTARSAWRSG